MADKIEFKTIWHSAGIPGVVLGAISSAYMLAAYHLGNASFTGSTVLTAVLDIAKFVACIWLMKIYLTRFHNDHEDASRRDLRRFGLWIAILSALIFATVYTAFYMQHTEILSEALDVVAENGKLDKNTMAEFEKIKGYLPRFIFICQFIYCTLFGWILSAILAGRILPDNPFAGAPLDSNAAEDEDEDNDEE